MLTSRSILFALLLPVMALFARPAIAFEEINQSYIGGVALGGYDAVSYFTDAQAVEGSKDHAVEWKGATWLFSSDANRQQFSANPEAYAPQYGGNCSNQMSLGNLSDIDPEVWRIIDEKLYLFGHDNGRVRWNTDTDDRVSDADGHWQIYLDE
jgi:YHS domain-containing protein